MVITDIALDPYTTHGHDGLIKSRQIANDETIEVLINQSLLQAEMGCDVLAPSDMMDGRVTAIREALDALEYANGGCDTPFGRRRCDAGHPQSFFSPHVLEHLGKTVAQK